MSEKLHHSGENLPTIEVNHDSEKNLERLREAAKTAEKDSLNNHVESLKQAAEAHAVSGKEMNVGDKTGERSNQAFGTTKHLKADAYRRSLRKIQGQLNAPERAMSKLIHQPAIEATSNVLAKTVARPSAFFGGSFVTLVGSGVLLYAANHYGFTYNYGVLLILFAVGFLLGLLVELLGKMFRRSKA